MAVIINQRIGVDLGSRWIKIAKIGQSPEGYFVEDTAFYETDGNINEKKYYKGLKENLEEYAKENNLKKMKLTFSIAPGIADATTLNILTLPTTDEKVLKKAIKFEMQQQDIIKNFGDEHYLWEKLEDISYSEEADTDIEESEILIATIKKNIVYELAQLRKFSWKIERIDLQHHVINRFIQGNATVIDFGHEGTRIYSFINGKLKSIEQLEVGGRHISEAIQEKLNTQTINMAEDFKNKTSLNYGFLNQNLMSAPLKMASEVATDITHDLIDEIKRAIRSFELGNGVNQQYIYYTGGGAALKNFIPLLTDELDEDVRPLHQSMTDETLIDDDDGDVFESLEDPFKIDGKVDEFSDMLLDDEFSNLLKEEVTEESADNPEKENEDGSDETEAEEIIGLRSARNQDTKRFEHIEIEEPERYDLSILTVFVEQSLSDSELNFEQFVKFKYDLNSLFIALIVMTVSLVFGVRTIHQQYDEDISQLNSEVNSQNSIISNLQNESSSLKREKQSYEELIDLVDNLKSQNKWYSDILYTIPKKTPTGVAVQHMRIQGDVIILDGYAKDYSNIGLYGMALEDLGEVNIVEIKDLEESDIVLSETESIDTDQLGQNNSVSKTFKIEIKEERKNVEKEYLEDMFPEEFLGERPGMDEFDEEW